MKRSDQHPVAADSLHEFATEPDISQPEQTGIDSSAEEEVPVPGHGQKPTMGALPVDTPGSNKKTSEWRSIAGDETHEQKAGGTGAADAGKPGENIVSNGTGPDPEHAKELI